MNPSTSARDDVLARIRKSLGRDDASPPEALPSPPGPAPTRNLESVGSSTDRLARFVAELEAVMGRAHVVHDPDEASVALRKIVAAAGATRVAHSSDPAVQSMIETLDANIVRLPSNASRDDLVDTDLGVTTAQWGLAETGSLVLESDVDDNRLVSLVPPHHVALLRSDAILARLEEVLERLAVRRNDAMNRVATLITGPSRTADIEMELVLGVHGPKVLDVIIQETKT